MNPHFSANIKKTQSMSPQNTNSLKTHMVNDAPYKILDIYYHQNWFVDISGLFLCLFSILGDWLGGSSKFLWRISSLQIW